jgi:eukaryotic-like serine/threonine-protein kinase
VTSPIDQTVASEPSETESEGDEAYCAACNQSFTIDHMFCPNDGAKLVKLKARADTLLGRVFDNRYEIRGALGHGGIKVIHPKLASVRQVAKRFLREARLSSRLNQPNIVNVYDFGQTEDGILYLVMELLRGRTLGRELEARRPLAIRRITAIASQICDGLESAHNQGIVHRDLKPQNVVILDEPPGRDLIKILDFGLAKSLVQDTTSLVTQNDALLGTPLYMPPEQILGKPSDQRADLYSLGCMLYQMASGRPPFVGENINVVLNAHIREPVPPLPDSVPPRLAQIIARLMMKAPEDRPATAALVHDTMTAIAESATSRPDTSPELRSAPSIFEASHSVAIADTSSPDDPTRAAVAVPPVTVEPVRRRWKLLLVAFVGTMAIAVAIGLAFRASSTPSVVPAAGDAAAAVGDARASDSAAADARAPDAAPPDAAPPDATAARDARAPAPPADARRSLPPLPDARLPRVDAGRAEPMTVDAAPAAAAPDAMPILDYIPSTPKH